MIALLNSQLPSGLAVVKINGTRDECSQRQEYPYVCRTKTVNSPQSVAPTPKPARSKLPCAIDEIMRNVDEMYDMFNEQMRVESKQRFMMHVRDFVGSAIGTTLVGRKASREILAYVAQWQKIGNRIPESFMLLCSFLLNARIHMNEKTYEWPGIEIINDVYLKK